MSSYLDRKVQLKSPPACPASLNPPMITPGRASKLPEALQAMEIPTIENGRCHLDIFCRIHLPRAPVFPVRIRGLRLCSPISTIQFLA